MTQTDNKIRAVKTNFSRLFYNALKDKETAKLSDIAKDLFVFIDAIGNFHYV